MRRVRRSDSGSEPLVPRALAGQQREPAIGAACLVSLGIVFVIELVTPETVVGAFVLIPVVVACWLLSDRWSLGVWLAAVATFVAAAVFESAGRATLILVAGVTLSAGWLARDYSARFAAILADTARGVRAPAHRIDASHVGSLTRRELEVARLASMAFTAAEIGRELHIGERTVESHLASTYAKLGIASKSELIRMASSIGPS